MELQGDHAVSPYGPDGARNHPLFVSVHYYYRKAVDRIKSGQVPGEEPPAEGDDEEDE